MYWMIGWWRALRLCAIDDCPVVSLTQEKRDPGVACVLVEDLVHLLVVLVVLEDNAPLRDSSRSLHSMSHGSH